MDPPTTCKWMNRNGITLKLTHFFTKFVFVLNSDKFINLAILVKCQLFSGKMLGIKIINDGYVMQQFVEKCA